MRYVPRIFAACVLAASVACTSSAAAPATAAARGGMPFSLTRFTETFTATAAEVIPVRGYVYVRAVLDDGSERWIASLPHASRRLSPRRSHLRQQQRI
jgi:hypothetical protein